MERSVWQGKRVRLRAVEPADWETYFAWNHDDEAARQLYHVPYPQSREGVKRFAEASSIREHMGDEFRFAIENESGTVVGDLTTHHCDPRVGAFSYGIMVRDEQRRKGYAAEAILLVLRHYFLERRYQKVTVHVYEFNEASQRLHERLGFEREGRERRTVYTNGRHYDQFVYGMTVEEFLSRHRDALNDSIE